MRNAKEERQTRMFVPLVEVKGRRDTGKNTCATEYGGR
jgi:hypothetical protein